MELLLRWDVKKNMFSCNSLCSFDPQLVEFSCSVVSDSLRPHELQHARPPCPSKTPGVHSNSCPLGQWCRPIISSSIVCFSSCLQSLPASGSFPMSQLFTWSGQSIRVSASTSVLPMNIQDWFHLEWMVWCPCSPSDSQKSSPAPQFKSINSSMLSFLYKLSHPYMTTRKTIVWLDRPSLAK